MLFHYAIMKILIATQNSVFQNQPVGGAETSLKLLGEHLAKNGHDVYYLTLNLSIKNIPHQKINSNELKVQIIQPSLLKRLSFKFLYKITRSSRLYHGFVFSSFHPAINELTRDKSFDITHCFYEPGIVKSLISLKNINGFKIVLRIAGLKWVEEIQKRPAQKQTYEKIFNAIDAFNFISFGIEQLYAQNVRRLGMKIMPKPKLVLDIGVPSKVRKLSWKRRSKSQDVLRIVMVARFSDYQKRQDLLVEALTMVSPECKVILTLIGEGTNKSNVKALADNLGVHEKVKFVPFVRKQRELWNILLKNDLMVHACDYEGLCKSIIESMAIGLPVLVSDVSPLNKYIKNGQNGFLVTNTSKAWAEAIEVQFRNRERLDEVSVNSRQFAFENYDPNLNVLEYVSFFTWLRKNK